MAVPGWVEERLDWALVWLKKTEEDCWEKREKLKMEHHEPDDTVKENLIDILIKKINQLLEAERNLLENESTYIGLNAAFCGLIANSLFQPILPVSQSHIGGGLQKAVIPFLMAHISYKGSVICIVKPVPIHEVDGLL